MQIHRQLERNAAESNGAIERLPASLDSPQSKLVYLYLATAGPGTIEELRDALGIEFISLYPVIDTLREKNLVRKDGPRYVCPNT